MATSVLGVASRAGGQHLSAYLVLVSMDDDGALSVTELDRWEGTRGQDAGRQLMDLRDAVANLLDAKNPDAPAAVAVKRVERPLKGKPPDTYDDRVRFEASAMMAAMDQGRRYYGYRKVELTRGAALLTQARQLDACPTGAEVLEAVAAACAALSDLGQGPD